MSRVAEVRSGRRGIIIIIIVPAPRYHQLRATCYYMYYRGRIFWMAVCGLPASTARIF